MKAYRSFGTKVHTVEKKLEEMLERYSNTAISKNNGNYSYSHMVSSHSNNDVKLDNLDMELSDDENERMNNQSINLVLNLSCAIYLFIAFVFIN